MLCRGLRATARAAAAGGKTPPPAPPAPPAPTPASASTRAFLASAGDPTSFDKLPTSVVDTYWDNLAAAAQRKSAADFPPPAQARGIPTTDKFIRRLLENAVKLRREHGDLLPSYITAKSCEFYRALGMDARTRFVQILARDFGGEERQPATTQLTTTPKGIDREELNRAVAAYLGDQNKGERTLLRMEQTLRRKINPLYLKFFTHIDQLPDGMAFLVGMRRDVLKILRSTPEDLVLKSFSDHLMRHLQSRFTIGFLDLERITWASPAALLEKIIAYEAVHPVAEWRHMKQRLGRGRLCYAFFHKSMPGEPLVFIKIALTRSVSDNVQGILQAENDVGDDLYEDADAEGKTPNTAIFYSISATQPGLSGVDLGNFLIKRVVRELKSLYPDVQTFSTLSPIPNFRAWLETHLEDQVTDSSSRGLLLDDEKRALLAHDPSLVNFKNTLSRNDWTSDKSLTRLLRPILTRLCARYLIMEKRRRLALDPVCNFHVRNGASVFRINWMGDASPKGVRQSLGFMANYMYVLPEVERNNHAYLLDGTISVVSNATDEHTTRALAWAQSNGANVRTVRASGGSL